MTQSHLRSGGTERARIGVDLGGTKIALVALDDAGCTLDARRVATPAGDYRATIEAVAALVESSERTIGRSASVGVGSPGAPSRATGLMKNCNSVVLNGRPLAADLEHRLRRPVRLANDADCFALSEATDGAGAGCATVFGVILGTGVGGGLVVAGRLLRGPNAITGEWGHNPLPWPAPSELPGPRCYCGRCGCLETWLSGPALAREAAGRGPGVGAPTAADVAARARAGEPAARASLDDWFDRLARGLATVINVVDPDAIVLGGGLSQIDEVYDAVPARWGRHVFSDRVETPLLRPRHGDASGVRGAAWLWPPAG